MLRPSKEERLSGNLLVQGAKVLKLLKKESMTIDELRTALTKPDIAAPSMERLMDIVTYLYLAGFIQVNGAYVRLEHAK